MTKFEERLNGYSQYFRFITPILVTITIFMINTIKEDMCDLDKHFSNHLSHHEDLEVGYEKRMSTMESTRPWLIQRIDTLENTMEKYHPLINRR